MIGIEDESDINYAKKEKKKFADIIYSFLFFLLILGPFVTWVWLSVLYELAQQPVGREKNRKKTTLVCTWLVLWNISPPSHTLFSPTHPPHQVVWEILSWGLFFFSV